MKVLVGGLNYKTAPLETRERLSLGKEEVQEALAALRGSMERGVILSTCNRWEVYTLAKDLRHGRAGVGSFLRDRFDISPEQLAPYLYYYEQGEAVRHLFRVASSLDSMILGEPQILGQVRWAFGAATRAGVAGGSLARLFHQALRAGKRARHETAIGKNALSVSRACVELARKVLGELRGRRIAVVGIGEAGKLAARALEESGAGEILVTNRTFQRAAELAQELRGRPVPFEELPRLLTEADIVVSSTGAPEIILPFDMVRWAVERRSEPLFLIDIAVPRDIDPRVAELPQVHLYDIDDLEMVSEANRRERAQEAQKVEAIVEEEVGRFMKWWDSLEVLPTIAALRQRAEVIRQREVANTLKRLPHLNGEEQARIEALSRAIVKRLLHSPVITLKERKDQSHTQVTRELFALDTDNS